MLALVKEIDTKSTSLEPFGKMITLKDGKEVMYAPTCSRDQKNPVSGSNRIKESDEYKSIVSEYDELLADFTKNSTNLIHKVAKLEVSERKRLLQEEIILSAVRLATSLANAELIRMKIKKVHLETLPSLNALTLGWHATVRHLSNLSLPITKALYFPSSEERDATITRLIEAQGDKVGNDVMIQNLNEIDTQIEHTIFQTLVKIFPLMTHEAWDQILEEKAIRAINTHLAVRNANKEQSKINQETEDTITDKVGLDKESMFDLFKDFHAKLNRSKSSGALKNQRSPGTNAGPNGNNPSKESQKKSKQPTKQATKPQEKLSRKQRKQAAKGENKQKQQHQPHKKKKQQPRKRGRGKGNQDDAASERNKKRRRSQK